MAFRTIDFYCLGATHLDIKARAQIKPELGDSIPVSTSKCFGGVATNIAANLSKMGAKVALCSIIGRDHEGLQIKDALIKAGIDIKDIIYSSNNNTASYHALLYENGELFIAASDMKIYDELTPSLIEPCLREREAVAHWIIDSNFSEESIGAIVRLSSRNQHLWGVGVSVCKAKNLRAGFPYWDGLFLNKKELEALSEKRGIEEGIRAIHKEKCPMVIVSAGKEGIFCSQGYKIEHFPSSIRSIKDVTGAGDALCAGILYGLFMSESLEEAIERGFRACSITIASMSSFINE